MTLNNTNEHYQLFRNKFTYLSFFLSIFVILIHTNNLDVYHIDSGFLFYFENLINSFANYAVPTFFMLSGYQFYRNLKPTEIKRKLKSRFFSIVIPFVIWGMIEFLYFGLLKSVPMIGAQMNASGKPFTLSSLMGILVFGESHLWFLRNLIIYHLVSLIFYRLLKNKYLFPAVAVCFVILPLAIPSLDAARGIIKNFPFYIFGAGLSCHFGEWFESDFKKKYIVLSGITAIILSFIPVFVSSSLLNIVIRLLGTVLVWIAASVFPIQKKPKGFITQSFFVYVAHFIVLESIEKLILIVFKNTLVGAWIDFAIAPIITIGVLYVGYFILHRFSKLWNVLTGLRDR